MTYQEVVQDQLSTDEAAKKSARLKESEEELIKNIHLRELDKWRKSQPTQDLAYQLEQLKLDCLQQAKICVEDFKTGQCAVSVGRITVIDKILEIIYGNGTSNTISSK